MFRVLSILLLVLLPQTSIAATDTAALPVVNARAWLLVDHHSGRRLAARSSDLRFAPSHFGKLMVAYIAFNAIKKGELTDDSLVPISQRAIHSPVPRMFATSSTQVSAKSLIKAMIVGRANDAAIALAEQMGSDEKAFVSAMNNEAARLLMNNTFYRDATGKHRARQYTDADDLAVLTQRIIRDHPQYYRWFKEREFSRNGITLYNRNALLWREKNVDGVMAVNSGGDGHHLIVSSKHDNMRLSAVILGAPDERAAITAGRELLKYGFGQYETRKLYSGNAAAVNMRVWLGSTGTLPVGVRHDIYLTLPRGDFDTLRAKLNLTGVPYAPIEPGQPMGTLKLISLDKVIGEYELVALGRIGHGGLVSRFLDRAEMWLRDIPDTQNTDTVD